MLSLILTYNNLNITLFLIHRGVSSFLHIIICVSVVSHKPFTRLYPTDIQQDTVKGLSFSYGQAYSGKKAQACMIHAMKNSECDCRNTKMTNASGISRMGMREYRKAFLNTQERLSRTFRHVSENLLTRVKNVSDTCQKVLDELNCNFV